MQREIQRRADLERRVEIGHPLPRLVLRALDRYRCVRGNIELDAIALEEQTANAVAPDFEPLATVDEVGQRHRVRGALVRAGIVGKSTAATPMPASHSGNRSARRAGTQCASASAQVATLKSAGARSATASISTSSSRRQMSASSTSTSGWSPNVLRKLAPVLRDPWTQVHLEQQALPLRRARVRGPGFVSSAHRLRIVSSAWPTVPPVAALVTDDAGRA